MKPWIAAALIGLATPVGAQEDSAVSAWSHASQSSVRLVAGGRNGDGAYRVGVEILLRNGFKTYWRVPGDAGVPPVFDWSASNNVGSVSVRWPAPRRFVDLGVTTIGYKDRVIFPTLIRPGEAGKPVIATLKLDYAVCDRICIPAKAEVTLRLPDAAETARTPDLDSFRALIPRQKEPGKLDDKPGLLAAAYVTDKGRKAVDVTIAVPPDGKVRDIFLEGPDGWLFGAPTVLQAEADKILMRVPIEDRPKNVVGMVPVVLTITGEPHSSEIRFDLDNSTPQPK